MVSSPLRSKAPRHTRSISLPSRSHPLVPQSDELSCRSRISSEATTSLSSMTNNLSSLEDLYNFVDDLLLLPHTQQVFTQDCKEKWVEETLDGYLGLVDACSTAKDILLLAKKDVQDLLSVLRRRREVDGLSSLLASRKKVQKMIFKAIKIIKGLSSRKPVLALEKDKETIAIVSMLKEAESVTLNLLESLLSNVAGAKVQSKWSLISKLIHKKTLHQDSNEFIELDSILSLVVVKSDSEVLIDNMKNQLKMMDSGIQTLEEKLNCMFKRLVRTRVSLLNMLSH